MSNRLDNFSIFGLFVTAFIMTFATCVQPRPQTVIHAPAQVSVDWTGFYSALNAAEKYSDSMHRDCLRKVQKKAQQIERVDHPAIMRAIDY